jgi:predicted unusual protein kinase regulating ubiquinone biosynthesis (AarF/ABC1/UbiB family)
MENEAYNKFPSFLPKPQESMIFSTGQNEEKEVFGVQIQSKINGENLLSFMQKDDVPLSEKIQTITRTLSLMEAINSQGIEHGDCHFGNIMYDQDKKTISVIDWAFARSENAGILRGACKGKGLTRDAYEFLRSVNAVSSHLSGSDLQEPAQQTDFDNSMREFCQQVRNARKAATSRGGVLNSGDINRF